MHVDTLNHHSWQLSYRGRVAVFIDGNNLFHAARFHTLDIDYNKLLRVLLGDGRLLRAFFYTGVDAGAERQQGFLLWMRRNGFRVIQKELKTFYDGTRKANLDVEIAVDMLSLAGAYDTAVLVSGDEDFVYAVNAVAYKGCRVEIAGFRSNTAPKLIDVADYFIDLGEIADQIRKDPSHAPRCYERFLHEETPGHDDLYLPTAPIATHDIDAAVIDAAVAEQVFSAAVERLQDLIDTHEAHAEGNGFLAVSDYIRITDD